MSDNEKKVEVRFGAFACTIEGYDNPVEQLREVLGLMQRTLAETPQLAGSGDGFDPSPIQSALDEDDGPGIVVIRNEGADTEDKKAAEATAEDAEPAEDVEPVEDNAEPEAEEEAEPEAEVEPEVEAETYDETNSGVTLEVAEEPNSDDAAPALATGAIAAAAAAYLNLRTGPTDAEANVAAEAEEPESTGDEAEDATPADTPEADAAVVQNDTAETSTDDPLPEASDAEADTSTDDAARMFDAAEIPVPGAQSDLEANIGSELDEAVKAAGEETAALAEDVLEEATDALEVASDTAHVAVATTEDAVEELGDTLASQADEAVATAEGVVEDLGDTLAAQADEAVSAATRSINIFAKPVAEDPVEASEDPEPVLPAAEAQEPQDAEPDPADAPTDAGRVNIFAAPRETSRTADVVNIFAAPAAAAAGAVASIFGRGSAAPEQDTQAAGDELPEETQAEAQPHAPEVAIEEPATEPLAAPDVVESPFDQEIPEAAPLASIFAPPPVADKVRDLGAVVSEAAPAKGIEQPGKWTQEETPPPPMAMDDIVPPAPPEAVEADLGVQQPEDPPFRSIFAPPPTQQTIPETVVVPQQPDAPEQPVEETMDAELEPEADAPVDGGRFQQLLSQVHGATTMSAPGENQATDPSPPFAPSDAATSEPEPEPDIMDAAQIAQISRAETVADQLAAAAAWLTLVKGQGRFTRREVMTVLETIPTDQPRELADRIKGFGKLVRSGVLVLIDDGVFAMAQTDRERFQSLLDRA